MDPKIIAECENEPLHLSGAIQGHGTLVAADRDKVVTHVARNAVEFLPEDICPVAGEPLPQTMVPLAESLAGAQGSRSRQMSALHGQHGPLDASMTKNGRGEILIELTPGSASHESYPLPRYAVPDDEEGFQRLRQDLVDRVFAMSGFQRVMYYRFREDGDGEVIAEKRQPEVYGSYLGLRYPASDVPQIARRLYLLNPWRLIADAASEPVPVDGLGGTLLDLSRSDLRSASPVHCIYLANMGARASLSFPLVKGAELVGLVACHHDAPRALPVGRLEAIARETSSHSLAFTAFEVQQRMKLVSGLESRFQKVVQLLKSKAGLREAWAVLGDWLAQEFRADGAWFSFGGVFESGGLAPDDTERRLIDLWFSEQPAGAVVMTDSLARDIPSAARCPVAGLIAINVKVVDGVRLDFYLARKEYIHEVAWGGNPEKPVENDPQGVGITPRRSFEKWVEKRAGHCRPWENNERLLALNLRTLLLQGGFHV